MDVTVAGVPAHVWIWAALDPVLVAVAVALGWRASQAGKIFVAAIAALGVALLVDALLTAIGLAWAAPLSRNGPMLLPVRSVGALLWAALAFAARRARDRLRPGS